MNELMVLGLWLGLLSTIFWMFVGWRALLAHEKLASAVHDLSVQGRRRHEDS